MSISNRKFLLIFGILGILVHTCTLHEPPPELEGIGLVSSSSSNQAIAASSSSAGSDSSFGNELSSSAVSLPSSSSFFSNIASSSSIASAPSSNSSPGSSSSTNSTSSNSIASSSSLALSSSSAIIYGSFTHEGQTYKTVVIGAQTWMAENMNYSPSSGKHRCYAQGNGNGGDTWLNPTDPQVKANCDKYGRLYDWATAKTVCPTGWHLPDTSDWGKLRRFIEKEIFDNYEDVDFGWDVGTKLKATTGWKASNDKGVDSYGFAAIGGGYCVSCEALSDASGYFAGVDYKNGVSEEAHWWSATEYYNTYTKDNTQAYKNKITYNKKVLTQEFEKKTDYLYSVRCIKN